MFAEPKPLGDRGLYWLKVQLANLYGMDKLSLFERVEWSESVVDDIAKVDQAPMSTEAMAWWCKAENPVQALACAFELHAAVSLHPEQSNAASAHRTAGRTAAPPHRTATPARRGYSR